MEQIGGNDVEVAFRALTENGAYLSKELFVKGMKKYQVALFTGLKPDAPDYEDCCCELYKLLQSQCETIESKAQLPLPEEGINPFEPALPNDVPEHLNFLGDSTDNPFGGGASKSPALTGKGAANEEELISLSQFK